MQIQPPGIMNLPTRSHLYPLPPIGIGTVRVESFISYLSRLAQAHRVTGSCLYARLLYPLCQWGEAWARHTEITRAYSSFYALQGMTERTKRVVRILEIVTCQPNLMSLTTHTWNALLDQPLATRKCRAWCSACYAEWRATQSIVYDPLSWSLQMIKVCSRHKRWLESICPHCKKPLKAVNSRLCSGFCLYCQQWLGEKREEECLTSKPLAYDLWVTNNLEELIALPFSIQEVQAPKDFQSRIIEGIGRIIKGESELSKNVMKVSEVMVFRQYGKYAKSRIKRVPKLEVLLTICAILKVSLLELLKEIGVFSESRR